MSERTPRKPPPGPPVPDFLPMRYVRWEQYRDIWPDETGSPFPVDNMEYPAPSPGWASDRDEQFYYWLIAKNVEPKWFHQDSCRKVKEELLNEFSQQWLEEGDYPFPKRPLWIKNYGGHRDMFYNTQSVNRLVGYIKHCIDWCIDWLCDFPIVITSVLNTSTRVTDLKSKRKTNGEQMASIGDLFEGYVDENDPLGFVGENLSLGWIFGSDVKVTTGYAESFNKEKQEYKIKNKRWKMTFYLALWQLEKAYIIEPIEDIDRERGTDHTMGGGGTRK